MCKDIAIKLPYKPILLKSRVGFILSKNKEKGVNNMRYNKGDFVEYKGKELGVVKSQPSPNSVRAYYSLGGTTALTSIYDIKKVSTERAKNKIYKNERVKESLFERRHRLLKGDGDVDDLIDERHIRPNVFE